MKLFATLHDPKSSKYIIYYSVVLASISIILILEGIGLIKLSIPEHIGTFFEGFAAMYMISRNEKVGNSFLSHLSQIKQISV